MTNKDALVWYETLLKIHTVTMEVLEDLKTKETNVEAIDTIDSHINNEREWIEHYKECVEALERKDTK